MESTGSPGTTKGSPRPFQESPSPLKGLIVAQERPLSNPLEGLPDPLKGLPGLSRFSPDLPFQGDPALAKDLSF